MLEPSKPGAEPDVVTYDAKTGKRSVLAGVDQLVVPGSKQRLFVQRCFQTPVEHRFCLETKTGIWLFDSKSGELHKLTDEVPAGLSAGMISPQADHVLVRRGRNLAVVDVVTGRVTPLTTEDDRGRLDNYSPSWSPDGRRIAYVQSDSSKVRTRPVLRPTDPTYPEVAHVPFARVGTPIPTLRVGIWGWSGGGTNTLNAMFRMPDVYHVGIAVAPKPRPELYNASHVNLPGLVRRQPGGRINRMQRMRHPTSEGWGRGSRRGGDGELVWVSGHFGGTRAGRSFWSSRNFVARLTHAS